MKLLTKPNWKRFIVVSLSFGLLTIPFIYNSCQGIVAKEEKSSSSSASSCKPVMNNGRVEKLNSEEISKSAFDVKKVQLANQVEVNGAQKASDVTLPTGSELAVVLLTSCSLENPNSSLISHALLTQYQINREIPTQALSWKLDRDYLTSELEDIANADPCIKGISWNRKYSIESYNDPGLYYQTHLNSIRAEPSYLEFYNPTYGIKASSGNNVIVAVVDTGIDWNHSDLRDNIWINAYGWGVDATTMNTSSAVNYNPVDVSTIGHGTHVSGIIAAKTNNSLGVAGTMPFGAKIMSIKVFKVESGQISTSSAYIYNGLQFAHLNGANVINLSLAAANSGPGTDWLVESGINEALGKGITVITVMGNAGSGATAKLIDGTNFSSLPGQFSIKSGVIGVGSFNSSTGEKSAFSHYSPIYAEIAAPGAESATTGIYSTLPTAINSTGYGRLAGTSQAGPQVSAAAAMTIAIIKQANGGIAPSPQEVERLILSSAIKSSTLTPYFKDGNRLDLLSLIQKIEKDYPKIKGGGAVVNPCL